MSLEALEVPVGPNVWFLNTIHDGLALPWPFSTQCALALDTFMCPSYSKSLPEALIHTQYESAKVKNVQVYASLTHSAQNFVFETFKISSDFERSQNNFVRLPWGFANRDS